MKSPTPPPIAIRELRAAMELKWLSYGEIAEAVGSIASRVSEVMSGKRNDAELLGKIREFIADAPTPEEVAA